MILWPMLALLTAAPDPCLTSGSWAAMPPRRADPPICQPTKPSEATWEAVCRRYGVRPDDPRYRANLLIPAALGGLNDVDNVWPQKVNGPWGQRSKQTLEAQLRRDVLSGRWPLSDAIRVLRADWIKEARRRGIAP